MRGVSCRSQGCRTCRRRKKGCDQVRPSCGQCLSVGLKCEGYGRDLVWVTTTGPAPQTSRMPDSRPVPTQQYPWQVRYAQELPSNEVVVLRDSFAKSAREQKYLGLFWSAYLPNGRAFSARAAELSTGGWTDDLGKLYDTESTLRFATTAMSMSVLGRQSNDRALVVKGCRAYSGALKALSNALSDDRRVKSDGLLAATRLMEFYEMLFGTDKRLFPDTKMLVSGWRFHNLGQRILLKKRTHHSVKTGMGHQLFADGRLNLIAGDIASRRSSEFAAHNWTYVPWMVKKERSTKDKLVDILATTTVLLEELDDVRRAKNNPEQQATMRGSALLTCKSCHEALERWEAEVGPELEAFDYLASGFPIPVPKTDLDTALLQISSLYWVVSIFIYSTLAYLKSEDPDQSPPKPSFLYDFVAKPYDHRRDPRLCAYKIAYSVHLFWEPSAGAFGNHIGLFPLGVAMRYLAHIEPIQGSDQYRRMKSLFTRPFLGSTVGAFLANLQRITPNEELRNMTGEEGVRARAHFWWTSGERHLVDDDEQVSSIYSTVL